MAARSRRAARALDTWDEAVAGLAVRPARTMLTLLSVTAGVAALIATLGIARTAGNQLLDSFDATDATQITIATKHDDDDRATPMFDWGAEPRLLRLNGVVAAGALAPVDRGADLITTTSAHDPTAPEGLSYELVAVDPTIIEAIDGSLRTGRFINGADVRDQRHVVVLGGEVAEALNVGDVSGRPAVYIGDEVFTVVGVIEDAPRRPSLQQAILMPSSVAGDRYGTPGPTEMLVVVEFGAAPLIARQAPVALEPNDPGGLTVTAPPDLAAIKDSLKSDVNVLFLVLGALSIVIGAVGITNTTLVSVIERRGEFGLRRALGARRSDIAAQVLVETGVVGLAAGCVGSTVGLLLTIAVAGANGWTPVQDPLVAVAAPIGATLIGLFAGMSPALNASRMEPAEALRA